MSRCLLSVLLLVSLPAAAAAADAYELKTRWGEVAPAMLALNSVEPAAESPANAELRVKGTAARVTDVTQVLRFQPHVIEQPPYEPGVRIPDHVATALIVTGGVALITSVIVEMLR